MVYDYSNTTNCRTKVQLAKSSTGFPKPRRDTTSIGQILNNHCGSNCTSGPILTQCERRVSYEVAPGWQVGLIRGPSSFGKTPRLSDHPIIGNSVFICSS